MSTIVTGEYVGEKRTALRHEESGATFATDAPKDNQGLGSSFSPTDLVGTALGSCMLTTMAIFGERNGLELKGSSFRVEKIMSSDSPRRIVNLKLEIVMPGVLTPEQRTKLERVAVTCPVHQSLHPDLKVDLSFSYKN